jgi:UrcA family protein
MNDSYRIASATALALGASLFAGGIALAQSVPEITVDVMRVVKAEPARPGSSYDVILKGHVSYADLDLSKSADVATLEKRINEEAQAICERIAKDYPDSTPKTAECAKNAAAKAMVQAKQAIAAKGTK